jgi:hypothetical protein
MGSQPQNLLFLQGFTLTYVSRPLEAVYLLLYFRIK